MNNYLIGDGWGKDSKGKDVYSSGNDPNNPMGYKCYIMPDGSEMWAYNKKDALMKFRHLNKLPKNSNYM